jgi:hypothetical protein
MSTPVLLISEVSPREFGNQPSEREVKFVDRHESRWVKADEYVWIHIIEARVGGAFLR